MAAEEKKENAEQKKDIPAAKPEEAKKAEATPKVEPAKAADTASATEAKEEEAPKLSEKMQGIMTNIEDMSVLELSGLVKALEKRFGVSAQAPMMAAGMMPAAGGGAAAEEEKTSFSVVLADIGTQKIQVIKELRAVTSLGLKEAKDLVDSAPKTVKEGATKEEAQQIKEKLEKVGAKVEIK